MKFYKALPGLILIGFCSDVFCQCNNTSMFPLTPVAASSFADTITVSFTSRAGDFYRIEKLALNQTYRFLSSGAADYITIRHAYSNAVLAHGNAPVSYNVGTGPDVVTVHINLQSPVCGTQQVSRRTQIVCTTCPAIVPGVGVGQDKPLATLDVGGAIKLGAIDRPPVEGMLRWNADKKDFEGYNGTTWVSLTQPAGSKGTWGVVPTSELNENQSIKGIGSAVSIHGEYAVIGAPLENIGANTQQGAAYIFKRIGNDWIQQAKLTALDGAANDRFGNAVSIHGDYVVIGAFRDDIGTQTDQGSAYVFVRSGNSWSMTAKLTASDGSIGDQFGETVAINGLNIIIGCPGKDIGANNSQGTAYIFTRSGTNWSQQARIVAADGASSDRFGGAVSISGSTCLIGVKNHSVGSNISQGAAYVFFFNGFFWAQQAKLLASGGMPFDYFGSAVSIDGNYAVIGAERADFGTISGGNQGSAFVYFRTGNTWAQQAMLNDPDLEEGDSFGVTVSMSGQFIVVGASSEDINQKLNQGAAYIFERNGTNWSLVSKVFSKDGIAQDFFGYSLGISGEHIVVSTQQSRGNVYFFRRN